MKTQNDQCLVSFFAHVSLDQKLSSFQSIFPVKSMLHTGHYEQLTRPEGAQISCSSLPTHL